MEEESIYFRITYISVLPQVSAVPLSVIPVAAVFFPFYKRKSLTMYYNKFMANYNCGAYRYIELAKIIKKLHLLHIYSKKLSLILTHIINN